MSCFLRAKKSLPTVTISICKTCCHPTPMFKHDLACLCEGKVRLVFLEFPLHSKPKPGKRHSPKCFLGGREIVYSPWCMDVELSHWDLLRSCITNEILPLVKENKYVFYN
jgi:hypothetical protein